MDRSFFEHHVGSPRCAFGVHLLLCLILLSCSTASAQKVWTSPTSGNWGDGTNWSGNIPPSSSSAVYITNANTKTVTIDATTPAANLTITTLKLWAPPGFTNTLLLDGAGTNNPLVCQVNLVLMDGADMRITNSALFANNTVTTRVGRATSGRLVINSGTVTNGALTVGGLTNSSGVMNLNGGTIDIATLFSIGRNASTTGGVFTAGGLLTATNDTARVGDSGVGQMTVSNSIVVLSNMDVGRNSQSIGTFTLQNGALVSLAGDLSIARFSGSTGTVFVTGGMLAATNDNIYVGREGSGQMTISNGTVQAASLLVAADMTNTASGTFNMNGGNLNLLTNLLVGGASLSTGQASVTGGTVTVTNPAGTAMVSVPNGGLTLNGGSLTADNLFLTNATGQFVFNGGTLNSQNATVNNGSPFVVGNGVTSATLHMMNGGTLSFANGLTISSNATLNGCGNIIGTIINHGTIATNCGSMLVQPKITGERQTGTTNTISFTTASGQTYTLEFKNTLADTTWTDILPPVTGTGSVMTQTDTAATVPTRFYRVRTQ